MKSLLSPTWIEPRNRVDSLWICTQIPVQQKGAEPRHGQLVVCITDVRIRHLDTPLDVRILLRADHLIERLGRVIAALDSRQNGVSPRSSRFDEPPSPKSANERNLHTTAQKKSLFFFLSTFANIISPLSLNRQWRNHKIVAYSQLLITKS